MNFLSWNDDFVIGIKTIDTQHKGLVEEINNLHIAMKEGRGKEVINSIVNKLVDYAGKHFNTEENIFDDYDYPDTKAHKEEHKNFVTKVLGYKEKIASGQLLISVDVMNFLKDWLVNHILKSDKKYGPYLKSKGLG